MPTSLPLAPNSSQGLFVLAPSPETIPHSTGEYLPRGAWKFPCSTGAELEVPDAAMVTCNAIHKVGPVARTGGREKCICGQWVGRSLVLLELCSLAHSTAQALLSILPNLCFSVPVNHPPMAVSQPHLTSFLAARFQDPTAVAAQGPNEADLVSVSHSCQGWRRGPHTARLLPPLAQGTSPEPRAGRL